MRTFLLAVALLGLTGCGRDPAPAPAEPPPGPSEPLPVQSPEIPASMAFVDASGVERLRLACGAEAPAFRISVPGFVVIGSEDRLTLGAGDEAFAQVADLEAPGPGVTGGGPVDPDLLDRLARGEPVRAVYGAGSVGPLRAARPEALAAFVERCRSFQRR